MAKSDRTRAQIIEGAIRALSESGVGGTTTRKIAGACGVPLATLHYHFESKSALLQAVLESLIDEMTRALREEVRDSADLDGCIEQVLRAAWRWVMRTRPLQIVQYELTLYALREGAEWLAERQYDAYVEFYYEFVRNAARDENRLSPAECRTLAHSMLAGVDGLILQELARPSQARSRRSIEGLITATKAYAQALSRERPSPSQKAGGAAS